MHTSPARTPWYRVLYIQVLIAVAIGIAIGHFYPETGKTLEPLSKGFIKLIKMMIAPIIFCTVVHGIASIGDLKKLGRVGGKTLLYFEVVSTLALIIGLIVVNTLKPGVGFNADISTLDAQSVATVHEYASKSKSLSTTDFLLNIIPNAFVGAFTEGNLLQVVFVALLTAFAISGLGERGKPILHVVDRVGELFFGIMRIVIKVAPLGALGAMAYTIGSYGIGSLQRLLALMLGFYMTSALFVIVVLGLIARMAGFSIFRFLAYIKDELLIVLGTSSSETVLPQMIQKLRGLGCAPSTVGLVIPTGYSFNLDGTNIYMVMGAVFLAQATNTPLDLSQQISLLLVAMVTSKGASGVTGAGFITLAATLSAVPSIPVEAMALILGIDRFMSECRSLTNLVGNGVATVVISRWEGELSAETLQANMRDPIPLPPPD
ncbi:aerobic C4-dicarboxylate transport protein [Prosthecobacter fusiformis]|uniref:Aerobic C4-dicarboxylate transport protein n=1 Tax=Prosthecobacter fusiformis TaxID=48464 RepID=A0A4R7S1X9_9BACT|nr:dicarboxylate/amino acid:cation symporter [Prosthecobacter fusiformis]TDU71225.1 aerobic C4-dicarboxylate transport protein [Prosthecobacter fusiformis]